MSPPTRFPATVVSWTCPAEALVASVAAGLSVPETSCRTSSQTETTKPAPVAAASGTTRTFANLGSPATSTTSPQPRPTTRASTVTSAPATPATAFGRTIVRPNRTAASRPTSVVSTSPPLESDVKLPGSRTSAARTPQAGAPPPRLTQKTRDHAPPNPARLDTVADRHDLPGHPVARHVRRLHREVLATPATADLRFDEQHVRDRDADHRLSGPGDRVRRVPRYEHLGTPNSATSTARIASALLVRRHRRGRPPTRRT